MSDIAKTVGPDLVPASVQHLDGLLGPLAAYLDALEARVGALERRLTAVPLMTAADAARYARVNVETILHAVRAGELAVAGYIGRSPRISRDALNSWLATRSSAAAPVSSQPRPASRAKGKRCRRGGMASAGLNVARQLGHSGPLPLDTYGSRDGRARPRTAARRGRRDHAGAQRAASGASGLDRIVGVMSASGSYDAVPSNRGRGATMGPPACSDQSSPVPFCRCCWAVLQGLSASWGDWRGRAASLTRKRSQVRVLDRPLDLAGGSACICRFPSSVAVDTERANWAQLPFEPLGSTTAERELQAVHVGSA